MAIPEGFTRAQLGLPEDDNRRTVERPTTGIWHILVEVGKGPQPATFFVSAVNDLPSLYLDDRFTLGTTSAYAKYGDIGVLEADDNAIEAMSRAGYEFTDLRSTP